MSPDDPSAREPVHPGAPAAEPTPPPSAGVADPSAKAPIDPPPGSAPGTSVAQVRTRRGWIWPAWVEHPDTPQRVQAICAALLVVITAAYTRFTYGQTEAAKKSADAAVTAANAAVHAAKSADDSFTRSERPYVLANVSQIEPMNGVFRVVIYFTNYGKSPAVRTKFRSALILTTAQGHEVQDYFAGLDKVPPYNGDSVVPPNQTPPGYRTADSVQFTPAVVKKIMATDGLIRVVGRIWYYDYAGNPYHTDYCFGRLASGASAVCDKNNVMQ